MADKKISQLTAATTPLAGTEVLPIVQSGSTVKATVANVQEAPVASGTANGLVYLNASKVPTTGSALTFNGTEVSSTGAIRTSDEFSALGGRLTLYRSAGASYIDWASAQNLNWRTVTSVGGGGATTLMTLGSTGDLTVSAGNLVVGTAGKGIDFSANTGAAGETSSLLDWYEEGNWNPALSCGTSGTITLTTGDGTYTRVGNQVTVTCYIEVDSVASPVGVLFVDGLPFTAGAAAKNRSAAAVYANGLETTATTSIVGRIVPSESRIRLEKFAAGVTSALAGDVKAGSVFQISLTYLV